ALRLADDFERAGAFVWIDKHDIKQGDFLKRINEGLARCDWLVLVETTVSLTSEAVEMEVNAALNRVLYHQMRGVLRCVAGPRDPRIVQPLWATLQYYDATTDYAAAVRNTLAAIRDGDARWAARPPASTTPVAPVASPVAATPGAPLNPASNLITRIVAAYADNDWHAVVDRSDLLLGDRAELMTVEVWRMRGRALLELARPTEATNALKQAYTLDTYDLPTVRAYARAERALGHEAEAEPLLKRAMGLVDDDRETRLDILREYVPTLQSLDRWPDALSRTDEALRLRPDDSSWQRQRLAALTHLNRTADALTLAQQIAARPDATAADWLAVVRLTRTAHPSPPDASDADVRAQITRALDAADRLAIRSQPADPALVAIIAQARRDLLPAPPPPAPPIPADRFPARLASLGFTPRKLNGVEVIIPPLCDIPAGPFLMGSDKRRDSQAQDNELPQHSGTLAAFQIARYPVTVAEYACAVRAGAAKEPPKGTYNSLTWQDQLQRLDHPAVGVSWFDAITYVTWLAKTTGQPWRLPTEAEWEKAARGTDGRIYPWGDAWDKSRANTSDGGPGTTTPVGTYHSGASPYGAQDLAGNVWEWCSSLYKEKYPYNPAVSEDLGNRTDVRVLRGGSWSGSPQDARAAYRNGNNPDYSNYWRGFRVGLGSGAGAS
ncbi:MAG TPA: SUMF1/EgtB/PvdO family nonheme iron enzyme, partial [Ktedonobacterales bacterium]|nr:SUMF1/EgtB/PvdO family nonheme iron enzyme [Ktedonobacterales bacterium]